MITFSLSSSSWFSSSLIFACYANSSMLLLLLVSATLSFWLYLDSRRDGLYLILLRDSVTSFLSAWIVSFWSVHLFFNTSMHSSSLLLRLVMNSILSISIRGSLENMVLLEFLFSLWSLLDFAFLGVNLCMPKFDCLLSLSSFSHRLTISLKSLIPLLYFSNSELRYRQRASAFSFLFADSDALEWVCFNSDCSDFTSAFKLLICVLRILGSSF